MPMESKPIDGLAVRTSDWGPDELALLYLDLLGYSDKGEPSLRPRPDENLARRPQPRTGFFSGDPVAAPSGDIDVQPLPEPLLETMARANDLLGTRFNVVAVEHFRNGAVSRPARPGFVNGLVAKSPVAVLGIGVTRQFRVQERVGGGTTVKKVPLDEGSLFVMGHDFLRRFNFSISLAKKIAEEHFSVTFMEWPSAA